MNKTELVNEIASRTDFTKKDTTLFVEELFNTIMDTVKDGEKISIKGFGNFELRERAARKARNMHTGETIEVPPSNIPAWKPAKPFKELVNKGQ